MIYILLCAMKKEGSGWGLKGRGGVGGGE